MSKTLVTTLVLIAVSLVASRDARGIQLDNARVIVPGGVASAGDGCIGSFTYDQASDTFYTVIFGSDYGMRSITNADGQWVGGWESHMDVWATDFALYMVSDDVPAGKAQFYEEGPNDYIPIAVVYSTPSAILLNPVPLTIDQVVAGPDGEPVVDELGNYVTQPITYQPGELAYIIDHAKEAYIHGERRYDVTKKMYRWDLRAIDEPTSVQPDFGNAEDGGYGTWSGEVGYADWNDIFTTVFTEQDFRDAASAQGGDGNCTHDNIGRQFAWSSDGLSIYFMESSTGMGGLWKVDAITGDLQWLHKEINVEHTYDNAYGEPTLVHTSTFDYTSGQYTGDQIFFDGSPANGNDSGISYVVHDGTNTSSAQVLLVGANL